MNTGGIAARTVFALFHFIHRYTSTHAARDHFIHLTWGVARFFCLSHFQCSISWQYLTSTLQYHTSCFTKQTHLEPNIICNLNLSTMRLTSYLLLMVFLITLTVALKEPSTLRRLPSPADCVSRRATNCQVASSSVLTTMNNCHYFDRSHRLIEGIFVFPPMKCASSSARSIRVCSGPSASIPCANSRTVSTLS